MSGGIYLIQDGVGLVKMNESDYETEALLQGYLAKHPDLLAGDQINTTEPRRWLLVSPEMPLPSEENGAERWSVDHLFLDQDAIPTIVEVKRSTDTRIRREVVGQMLDYASNAVVYWSVDKLRARFEASPESEQDISDFLEDTETDPEEFWQKVKTNLQAGKVRLIFVSDKIPDELRRIVEFLNEQMNPAEVLAVEVKQYVGEGMKTLVPRVVGQTVEAQQKKSGGGTISKQLDEESFLQEIEAKRSAEEAEVARKALEWAEERRSVEDILWWGKNQFTLILIHDRKDHRPLAVSTSGELRINLKRYQKLSLPDSQEKLQEFLDQLNDRASGSIPTSVRNGVIKIDLAALKYETDLKLFLETLDWLIDEIRKS